MGEEIAAQDAEIVEDASTRPVPAPVGRAELQPWQWDARAVALAAAGGAVAGVATVAAIRAARASRRPARGWRRRGKERVVASRSFLIDVHVLGK
jgi:hypothetical protein